MSKDWLVAALLRLYPAAWRREYGEELTAILLERPLNARVIADVAWNGLRLSTLAAEPSTILGIASLLIIVARFVLVGDTLRPSSKTFPTVTVTFLASNVYAFLLIGCGCWTHLRRGGTAKQSGVAAMKMSLIAGMPIIVGALLMMIGLVGVSVPAVPLHDPSPWSILVAPLARLPEAWLWGTIGGFVGKGIAHHRQTAPAIRP